VNPDLFERMFPASQFRPEPKVTAEESRGIQALLRKGEVREERAAARKAKRDAARRALVDNLIRDVKEGILMLRDVYGLPVTDEMASDRANNIVCGLIANHDIRALETP